jgi:hypothetical protein
MKGTYDTAASTSASLTQLLALLHSKQCTNVYVKKLAPNDNSKNQTYFGSHLTDLSVFAQGEAEASSTVSLKSRARKSDIKYQVGFPLKWVDIHGQLFDAPHAKLIYYPQYPEVRFSGFLKGSPVSMSQWMSPEKFGRAEDRWLILATGAQNFTYGFLATPKSRITYDLSLATMIQITSVFCKIANAGATTKVQSSKDLLLNKLVIIQDMGWVAGKRMHPDLSIRPYTASNGGGYTLEALLEIPSNAIAEPDFHGWEVKQFGTTKGITPTTLMDHSPNGGYYQKNGIKAFISKYGYPDKSGKPDRLNFGGIHKFGHTTLITGLTMLMHGFDPITQDITDANGFISLVDEHGNIAASWSFSKLMDHWKRKHAKAAFIPSIKRLEQGVIQYSFGHLIELGTGASFSKLLASIHSQFVYYDPGLKWENMSTANSKAKARHPIRVKHKHLATLYDRYEIVNLNDL